ncbi:MAG TPA: cytochrome c [Caulobacter sp.]|nr:cytochrome c [Caulobacter sp.]
MRTNGITVLRVIGLGATLLCLSGCERETRALTGQPPAISPAAAPPTDLRAGGGLAPPPLDPVGAQFEGNAFEISEGQRYYDWYNCYGCHGAGGGDIGPALMDDEWRYGGSIAQIRASIAEGRPNGMPSFSDKIPDRQLWQIAAYVRSMSGRADKLAASSRADAMRTTPPNNQARPGPDQSDTSGGEVRR